MTNWSGEADAVTSAFVASGSRATRTCPTSMDGATDPVEDNVGESGGGLVLAEDSDVAVLDTVIRANSATFGGGVFVPTGTTLELAGSTVEGNVLTYDDEVAKLRLIVEVADEIWGG